MAPQAARGGLHHLFLCQPSLEDVAHEELQRARDLGRTVPVAGGLSVSVKGPPEVFSGRIERGQTKSVDGLVDPAFSRQVVPYASFVEGVSHGELVAAIFTALPNALQDEVMAGTTGFRVFAPDIARIGSRPLDEHPLASSVREVRAQLYAKAAGRAAKLGIERSEEPPERFALVLVTATFSAWVSQVSAAVGRPLEQWPSALGGEEAPVFPSDHGAPSSAHRKLDEAFAWLPHLPGPDDTVLDLGAAPGGWTYVCLNTGAKVIAVDRGKMDPTLLERPRLTHLRKDAFAHAPLDEADWIVCDIIGDPHRTLDLLEEALSHRRLRGFVVTLKLTRPVDFSAIARGRSLLAGLEGWSGRVKNLLNNKCEVTLMGTRDVDER